MKDAIRKSIVEANRASGMKEMILFKALFTKKTTIISIVLLAVLMLLPQFLPRFYIYLFAMIFAICLLATSLNMVLGFGGMYQFHHAVFYGVGAYAFALFAVK